MSVVGLTIALAVLAGEPPKALDPLAIDLYASEPDIVTPTGLAVDADGRVLVIESHTHFRPKDYKGPPADRIRVFEDTDGDGRADKIGTFFEGSKWTMGIGLARDGSAYVATRNEIFRLRDADGDGKAEERTQVARLETPGDYPHNGLSGFAFDFEGNVYFGLGENLGVEYALIGADGTKLTGGGEGGNIYRCRPDGSGLVRIATGFWNPFHLGLDTYGRLFAVDNDPDSRPPCRLLHIVEGGDYGYRFRNGRKGLHPFTAWNGELPGTLPMVAGTGEAPSGVVSYESDHLPSDYRGNLLATSWGDHRIERFQPQPRGASVRAVAEPIITGGVDFRPVGLVVAPDGSLFASDWVDESYPVHGKGRVWHIRSKNTPVRARPDHDEAALAHADLAVRRAAACRLTHSPEGREILRHALKSSPEPRARAVCYEALRTFNPADGTLASALGDAMPEIRALAARTITDALWDAERIAARDTSPMVRAEALRRLPARPAAEPLLLSALDQGDPFLTRAALEGMKRAISIPRLLELARDPKPAHRLGVLLVLRESAEPRAREPLQAFLADPDPMIRTAAIQWVAEHDLKEFRPQVADGLAKRFVTRALFEAYVAALQRLDGVRGKLDETGAEESIAAIVADPKTPAAVRRRALGVLRPDHPSLTLGRLRDLLRDPDADLKKEAVRSLRESPLAGRIEALQSVAADDSEPESVRAEAILGLAGDDAKVRAFLVRNVASQGTPVLRHEALRSLRGSPLDRQQITSLADLFKTQGDTEAARLLATLAAANRDPGAPDPLDLEAWLKRLDGPADRGAGERTFFHPKGPGCFRCHQVDGRGGRTGPELSSAGRSLTRPKLIESILSPSREMAPQFVPWLVAKSDGTLLTGTLLEETAAGEQIYADAKGDTSVIKSAEIVERKPQTTSIMPADLARLMTLQEFRDLLAYLQEPSRPQ